MPIPNARAARPQQSMPRPIPAAPAHVRQDIDTLRSALQSLQQNYQNGALDDAGYIDAVNRSLLGAHTEALAYAGLPLDVDTVQNALATAPRERATTIEEVTVTGRRPPGGSGGGRPPLTLTRPDLGALPDRRASVTGVGHSTALAGNAPMVEVSYPIQKANPSQLPPSLMQKLLELDLMNRNGEITDSEFVDSWNAELRNAPSSEFGRNKNLPRKYQSPEEIRKLITIIQTSE